MAAALAAVFVLLLLPHAQAQGDTPITLNYNLGTEPLTLDPAKSTDTASHFVIEQLFIGLVDLDDETGEVVPELAASWEISPDGTVYTFTLRSDVTWTDGNPVTAHDARYGILRTLDPATEAGYAYALYLVKNAEAYNTGQVGADQVGVEALDDTHLRVTLEYPASHFLSILGMPMAQPMPRWAIEAHGDAWTEPGNIVTNGPYRLTEWVHDDHIILDKNPTYYDVASIQIERVKMWMVSDIATSWEMYLSGQLDITTVPRWEIPRVRADPLLSGDLRVYPISCTYYYGFSVAQPPLDNPLVRKAFIAAVDRQGLIDSVLGGVALPALTYTPPGIFGHVDGYAEGVGIPYDPVQAREWLAEAGYADGQGLPEITLWFNTSPGHQAIAEYI